MRTDFKDPNAIPPSSPVKSNASGKGGCFSTILMAIGALTIVIAIVGYILSFFDMVLVIQNSKLPMINLEIFIPLLVCGGVFLLLAWLISRLEKFIRKKRNKG